MYFTLEEARKEILRRSNDTELQRCVQEYVGEVPSMLSSSPKAIWFRSLPTPNFECVRFFERAAFLGLEPLFLEFMEDKFCVMNPDKVALGKMTFYHGRGKRNGNKTSIVKVIDFNQCSGKSFGTITTTWGDGFVSFHQHLLNVEIKFFQKYDLSAWCKIHGGKPFSYYHRVMALFICHGVLFENFFYEGAEGVFVNDIVLPAISKVTKHFGLKPLIVRLLPMESESDPYWCWYPGHLEKTVEAFLQNEKICSFGT